VVYVVRPGTCDAPAWVVSSFAVGRLVAAPASRVRYYLERRPFAGPLAEADAIGGANVDGRPPEAVIYLQLEEDRIVNAGIQASGCGYLIACCSALMELCVGQSLSSCRTLDSRRLEEHLGGLPETKRYCAELAVLALRNTLAKLSAPASREEESA
jgi:NifU-like protein involved in Fe-S cluster formation